MKAFSVSQEALWGLKSFLGVVPAAELAGMYPELGVKAIIRVEGISDTINKAFEDTDFKKALVEIESTINDFRKELIAPFDGAPIPPEDDRVLSAKIQERFTELQKELLPAEVKEKKIDFELSDEKGGLLKDVFDKLGAKYLLSKQTLVLIAKDLGIDDEEEDDDGNVVKK
jgi:hypothetical protein